MSFLTPEQASNLGQAWYGKPNTVAGMGGILSMSELTSTKNFHLEPSGLDGMGLPVSDLIPGEFETGTTLVDTSNGLGRRRGRGRGRRYNRGLIKRAKKAGICVEEMTARKAASKALRACASAHTKTQIQGGIAAGGTAATTVASEGMVLAGLGAGRGGRAVPVRDLVPGELTHAAKMISLPQAFGGMGIRHGNYGRAVPVRDLVPGELTHAAKMISLPQAFGGMGAGSPVPRADFVRGEIVSGGTLVDHAQGFGSYHGQYGGPVADRARPTPTHASKMTALPQANRGGGVRSLATGGPTHASKMISLPQAGRAVPVRDLVPGELTHASKMISLPQAFGGMGAGSPVPVRDLVHGELTHASKMISLPQAFGGMGSVPMGRPVPRADFVRGEINPAASIPGHPQAFGSYAVPRGDFIPGEIVSGGTLVDHAQGFGSYHGQYGVPIADLKRGEYERARAMVSHPQAFGGMGDWIPFQMKNKKGKPQSKPGTQGTWLSPDQVPAWDRESAANMISHKQNFGGLGNNAVPEKDFVEGEIESASRMLKHGQQFGGLGAFLPYEAGMPEPTDGAQGTWLSPDQVPAWDRESAKSLISGPQNFGGLGATGDNVKVGELNLTPICDPKTGACISYATPQEIQAAIGAKVGGQSALVNRQAKLPAFYEHPNLGPWGVDPAQAYQYWWSQQAAMQRAGAGAPISIWGSPGAIAPTPPLPASPLAQQAAINPYTNAYPVAGAAVERF